VVGSKLLGKDWAVCVRKRDGTGKNIREEDRLLARAEKSLAVRRGIHGFSRGGEFERISQGVQ
jgi:hypothetical protein